MSALLGFASALLLLSISGLHLYWALGGESFKLAAIPQIGNRPSFKPTAWATLAVALALFAAAWLVGTQAGLRLGDIVPGPLRLWICRLLALIFLARAIGDFRLVGLFKKIRDSRFAYWDTRVYSPLCLFLALGCAVISR
jgi:hypothetical protein